MLPIQNSLNSFQASTSTSVTNDLDPDKIEELFQRNATTSNDFKDSSLKVFTDLEKTKKEEVKAYKSTKKSQRVFNNVYLQESPPKRRKSNGKDSSIQIQEIFEKEGNLYYFHPDKHGHKHTAISFKYNNKEILIRTKKGPATFYSGFAQKYKENLEVAIRRWVDRGADPTYPIVDFNEIVGADRGVETSLVEIYYGEEVGSHIRPKAFI